MHSAGAAGRASGLIGPSRVALLLVAVAAVLSCYPFIVPGHPSTVDVWPHLARQSLVYHALKEGFSPFYTFMYYCGFPALRFYSPLFYFLGGPLTLLTSGNLLLALRILLVLLHLTSALAMYLYLLRRGAGFGPALGAIVYLVIPWRTMYLTGVANYPLALVYVLLPLAFLALEDILEDRDTGHKSGVSRPGLLLGLWVALLFLAHLVYAIFTLLLLLVWWVARKPGRVIDEWRSLVAAVLACTGVSAFFLIPFAAEQASHRFPITHLNLSVPDWRVLLGLKERVGGYAGLYLGLSVVLLLLLAIGAVMFRRRARSQIPALVGLTVSLFLTFGPALLKEKQYLITTGLPPERFLVFVVFLTALLVPSAYEVARNALAGHRVRPGVLFTCLAVVVMIDCLLPLRQFRLADRSEFLAVREEIYPLVRGEPHARLLDLNIPRSKVDDPRRTLRLPTVGVIYGGLATPLGLPYHQYAPRSMLYVYPWVDYMAGDIGDASVPTISDDTPKALALLGVSHLVTLPTLVNVTDTGPSFLALKQGLEWDDRFVAAQREPPLALGLAGQGLVLAANRTAPMAPDTLVEDLSFIVARNWRQLLDAVQLDEASHRLGFIPTPAGSFHQSLPGLPELAIDSTRIRHPEVVTGFRVSADCFLRVAVSYYPELSFLLDGRPVAFFETADHFTYIRCPAGAHVLTVRTRLGALRIAMLLVSLVSLPIVLVLILRRRPRPSGPSGT